MLASKLDYSVEDKRLINDLVADRFVSSEIQPLITRAGELSPAEAYELLKDWVLPNEIHQNFRMQFKSSEAVAKAAGDNGDEEVGSIMCPAATLVQIAEETGQVGKLIEEIQNFQPQNQLAEKSKQAMLFLAAAEQEDKTVATEALAELYAILEQLGEAVPEEQRSPEMLVALRAAESSEFQMAARDIAKELVNSISRNASANYRSSIEGLQGQVASLRLGITGDAIQNSSLNQWTVLAGGVSAAGSNPTLWNYSGRGILNRIPGQMVSQLIFQSPLEGNFEIHADLTTQTNHETYLTYGMRGSIVSGGGNNVRNMTVFKSSDNSYLDDNIPNWGAVAHYKVEVGGSTVRTFVNDVEVSEKAIDGLPEPWLMLHPQKTGSSSAIRNLRIVGAPTVPDEINLSQTDMAAWYAVGSGQKFLRDESNDSEETAAWTKDNEEIRGDLFEANLDPDAIGKQKSRLIYHRPLLEDGEFEFESFYKAGEFESHPSVGTSAFIVSPDGIEVRKTNGDQNWKGDEIENSQSTSTESYETRPVELKEDDWNKFVVKLTGDRITLTVNDNEVLQHDIEDPAEKRNFGFFRYADKFKSRIRRIKYRGNWPKQLPVIDQQELAYPAGGVFTDDAARVSESVTIDLAQSIDEIAEEGLNVLGPAEKINQSDDGSTLMVENASQSDGWPGFVYANPIAGDFDASIDFSELQLGSLEEGWGLGFDLEVELNDSAKTIIGIGVQGDKSATQFAKVLLSHQKPNDVRAYEDFRRDNDFDFGKLRLVRRGRQIHCLFASGDEPLELIESFVVGESDVKELRILAKCSDANTKMSVKAKQFSLLTYDQ